MKWIVLLALTTLAAAPAAAEVVTNVRVPIAGTTTNDCNGEDVNFTGEEHFVFRATLDGSGGIHLAVHSNIHVTGTGVTTGAKYTGSQEVNEHLNLVGAQNGNLTITFRLIGQGKVPNLLANVTAHFTVNANGNVTVDRTDIRVVCR